MESDLTLLSIDRMIKAAQALSPAITPRVLFVQPRAVPILEWFGGEVDKWEGRNWRRIKREQRKFLARRGA